MQAQLYAKWSPLSSLAVCNLDAHPLLNMLALEPQGFDTTQGKHIDDDGANAGAVKIKSTRRTRQYMNRRVRLSGAASMLGFGP